MNPNLARKAAGRPPLGIKPRHIHEEQRMEALGSAINRYVGDGLHVPTEWVEEYNELQAKRSR